MLLALLYPFHSVISTPLSSVNLSMGDILIAFVIVVFVLGFLGAREIPYYSIPVLLFAVIAVLSLIFAAFLIPQAESYLDHSYGLFQVIKFLGGAAWMLAVFVLLKDNPKTGLMLFAAVSVTIAVLFASYTLIESLVFGTLRPSGPFANPNLYGNWLAFNVFLAGVLAHSVDTGNSQRLNYLYLAPIVTILGAGILYTGSRGALLGLIGGLLFVLLLAMHQVRIKPASITSLLGKIVGISAVAFVGVGILWRLNPFIARRISSIFSGSGPNIETRFGRWESALTVFYELPILGSGYYQSSGFAEIVWGVGHGQVHNTYLQVMADTGIVGFITFMAIIALAFRDSFVLLLEKNGQVLFVTGALGMILIQGLFTNAENFRSLWICIGIIGAMVYNARGGGN